MEISASRRNFFVFFSFLSLLALEISHTLRPIAVHEPETTVWLRRKLAVFKKTSGGKA
ncbi:hypothetical protein VVD49_15180 [Uliginosibacterium sp. H3]|uniref:Uncharacterized protein n=1 Tax=Uliginosibacterium silvisoli TaxID=3114758 RepID=A0ABU6K5R3_9RHOO|nr:hypothetical protein [Uliginosibacterium sp. H3]